MEKIEFFSKLKGELNDAPKEVKESFNEIVNYFARSDMKTSSKIPTYKFKESEKSFESLRDFIFSRYMELFEDPKSQDVKLLRKFEASLEKISRKEDEELDFIIWKANPSQLRELAMIILDN